MAGQNRGMNELPDDEKPPHLLETGSQDDRACEDTTQLAEVVELDPATIEVMRFLSSSRARSDATSSQNNTTQGESPSPSPPSREPARRCDSFSEALFCVYSHHGATQAVQRK